MLRSRFVRRIAPMALVVGFAISVPIRADALGGRFDSTWAQQFLDFILETARGGLFDRSGRPAEAVGTVAGGVKGLFGDTGLAMDPNGRPLPSAGTGGGTTGGTPTSRD